MPTALQLAEGHPELTSAVLACRKLLHRRAVVAAAASAVPLPGLDWAVDAALLARLIPAMNARFGLAPDQIDAVRPDDLLILPWNLREEIMAQTGRIRAWGGRFVTASPEPRTWD